jgi:hypothetical protein
MFQPSAPEKLVAEIERAYATVPAPEAAPEPVPVVQMEIAPEPEHHAMPAEERARLEALLAELLELKARLKNRRKQG